MEEAYSRLAAYYDRLMRDFDYDGYLSVVMPYLQGKKKGVDLACGSGAITIKLALMGKSVVGMDISEDMLRAAAKNARKAGVRPVFVRGNIEEPELPSNIEFITAVCDGFNYVKDIGQTIARCADALKKDGTLIFDVSSDFKLMKLIGNEVFYEDCDDVTWLWTNKQGKGCVDMELTFFVRGEDGRYTRYDEKHTQYVHTRKSIERALRKAGFKFGARDVEGKEVTDFTDRIIYICVKE